MPYNPHFIAGHEIPLPSYGERIRPSVYGDGYIHHSRHSLLFNENRGLAFISAHNIDGASLSSPQYTSRSFRLDPLINTDLQIDNDRGYRESNDGVFGPNPWDRGHLARRKTISWGSEAEASQAERESDYWSNIAPQHENLHDDAWGKIEDWMLGRVEHGNQLACVFTGPVFTEDDPKHNNGPNEETIQIPAGFWKVISIEMNGAIRSAGFLIWQRDYDHENPLPFAPVLEQVRLTTIEVLTGLTFPSLRLNDPLLFNNEKMRKKSTKSTAREKLKEELIDDPYDIATSDEPGIDEELVIEATSPGTSIITSMRDIVL